MESLQQFLIDFERQEKYFLFLFELEGGAVSNGQSSLILGPFIIPS